MKRGNMNTRLARGPAGLLLLAALILSALLLSGCGKETSKANELVQQAVDIETSVETEWQTVNQAMKTALDQQAAGQMDAAVASLSQAQASIGKVESGLTQAKAKIDEAAQLNVSDVHRQYLEATSRGLQGGIDMMQASARLTAALLSDPSFALPETRQQLETFQQQILRIGQEVQAAEDEAARIAAANPDEIEAGSQ